MDSISGSASAKLEGHDERKLKEVEYIATTQRGTLRPPSHAIWQGWSLCLIRQTLSAQIYHLLNVIWRNRKTSTFNSRILQCHTPWSANRDCNVRRRLFSFPELYGIILKFRSISISNVCIFIVHPTGHNSSLVRHKDISTNILLGLKLRSERQNNCISILG